MSIRLQRLPIVNELKFINITILILLPIKYLIQKACANKPPNSQRKRRDCSITVQRFYYDDKVKKCVEYTRG